MFTQRNRAVSGIRILAVIVALLWCGAVFSQDVKYDYDRSVNFAKYKTYKWVSIEGASHPDQLTDKDIKQAIDQQIATKALTKKDADPVDLFVGYQISVEQEKQLTGFGGGPGWRMGGGMASATTSTINVGTIAVDVYDPATKSLVWRGQATDTLDSTGDPDKRMKRLQKAMTKLIKSYPPAAASK